MRPTTPAGDTTRLSADPSEEGKSPTRAAIQWVYPTVALSLIEDEHVLGRDESCDTVLRGDEVSRRHAQLGVHGILPSITDLQSRNGLYVNGVRESHLPIGPRDVIRIGGWLGVVVECRPAEHGAFPLVELFPGWYGGRELRARVDAVRRVATTALPVIVQGETGTGKEGLARALHSWSGRRGAFVAVDCGALPEPLAEGALFGYRKGAFTGADRAHEGYFQAAHEGTLFLDEVLNLPATIQAKLLRVLERGEVVPLGHSRPIRIDVRIVCAAQGALPDAVDAGRFRADLLARLDGITVVLPPLRDRREDILSLFERFVASVAPQRSVALDTRFAEALLVYDWPLNVRELVHLAQRLVALHEDEPVLRKSMLPARWTRNLAQASPTPVTKKRSPVDDPAEREMLLAALRDHEGNVSRAAKATGVSRSRAYRVMDAHPKVDISPSSKPDGKS